MTNILTTKHNQDGIAQIPALIGVLAMSIVILISSNVARQRQELRKMAQLTQPVGYCGEHDDGTAWDQERCCCPASDGSCSEFTDYGDRAHNPQTWCSCCQRHNGVDAEICSGCPEPSAEDTSQQCPDPYPTPYAGNYPWIKMTKFCVEDNCGQELKSYPNQVATIEFDHQNIAMVKACTRPIGGNWTDDDCNFVYTSPFSPTTVKTNHLTAGSYEVIVAGYNQTKEYSCSARAWYTGYNPPTGQGKEGHPPPIHCLRDDITNCRNEYFKLTIKEPEVKGCDAPCNGVGVVCEENLTCHWTGQSNLCRHPECLDKQNCSCQPEATPSQPTPTLQPSPTPVLQECEFGFEVPG
jgi:hypothetical protein